MASKIESRHIYMPITLYEEQNQTYDRLNITVGYYDRYHRFEVTWHSGWENGCFWGCTFDFSRNPLTAGITVPVKDSPRNSQKFIDQMYANLNTDEHKAEIARLFDAREWNELKQYLKEVALTGSYSKPKPKEETVVKQVDIEGVFGSLYKTGQAKLSDFAKPIETEPANEEPTDEQPPTPPVAIPIITPQVVDMDFEID